MKIHLIPVILILLSCNHPQIEIPTVQENMPEIIIEEEIMERTFKMNPIPSALGYIFQNGFLRGVTAETDRQNFLPIRVQAQIDSKLAFIILDDFFTKSGKLYFSMTDKWIEDETEMTKERYFEQSGQTVTEIEIMPDKPAAVMIDGEMGAFKFEKYSWEKSEYSRLSFIESAAIISTAKSFDSAVLTDKGILFSQPEKLSREAGLWFMGNEQRGGPTRISDYVIIWK